MFYLICFSYKQEQNFSVSTSGIAASPLMLTRIVVSQIVRFVHLNSNITDFFECQKLFLPRFSQRGIYTFLNLFPTKCAMTTLLLPHGSVYTRWTGNAKQPVTVDIKTMSLKNTRNSPTQHPLLLCLVSFSEHYLSLSIQVFPDFLLPICTNFSDSILVYPVNSVFFHCFCP